MKVGLYFGTFNPIHVGHVIIANHIAEFSDLDEVWFVVTPQSPDKKKQSLLGNYHRFELVYRALDNLPKLKPSDIEFKLPQPNYTIHTLVELSEKYPQHQFSLIMGSDNLKTFHKWKNNEAIIEDYDIYVYPRMNVNKKKSHFERHPKVHQIEAPIIQISSTLIRNSIQQNKNVTPLLPPKVLQYIDEMNFYRK